MTNPRARIPWAGLAAGPGAWALNTQASYALAATTCTQNIALTGALSLAFACIALIGAFLSWRAWSPRRPAVDAPRGGEPHRLLAGIGTGLGLLFALVILTQASASLLIDGCLR